MNTNDSLTEVYVYENSQLLEQLEEMLLDGEKSGGPSKELIDEIFRVMHTIKGASAMMGYVGLTNLSHGIEDMFAVIRNSPSTSKDIWEEIINLVLECVDFIKGEIAKIQQGLLPDGDSDTLHQRAEKLAYNLNTPEEEGAEASIVMPGEEAPAEDEAAAPAPGEWSVAPADDIHRYKAHVRFTSGCAMESIRAFAVVSSLEGAYTRIWHTPEDLTVNCDEEIAANGFTVFIESTYERPEIESRLEQTMFLQSLALSEVEFDGGAAQAEAEAEAAAQAEAIAAVMEEQSEPAPEPVKSAPAAAAPKAEPAKPAAGSKEAPKNVTQTFLSVNVSKVNKLMDLVGEIVTTEAMVTKNPEIVDMHIESFEKQSRRLRQLTDELQDVVMSIRMVPISATFRKMQRIVRDMCHNTGKEAQLVLVGEQTEVDKNVIEHLSDPLMHMIRNSMDHGIEHAEERIAKGKPAMGTITLEARNTGGDVIIMVSDDGRGLDRTKIIKKAQERGLTTKHDSEISDKEAFNFIMMPGFSTNDEVTEYSGRGVGMDVVCSNIDKLGGSVTVESELGRGTTTTLHIPLTLAIIDGMDVQVGKEHYIIPILNIQQSFEVENDDIIVEPDGSESIIIRGNCYQVRRLQQLFGIPEAETDISKGIMMLVESDLGSVCLFMDRIVGEQQAVVKPIPTFISRMVGRLPYISGCSVMGNGISLIMDINSLVDVSTM